LKRKKNEASDDASGDELEEWEEGMEADSKEDFCTSNDCAKDDDIVETEDTRNEKEEEYNKEVEVEEEERVWHHKVEELIDHVNQVSKMCL